MIEELKKKIGLILEPKECSAQFFFLLLDSVKSMDIDATDQNELAKMFIESLKKKIVQNDDLSIISLSSADERENALYEYDLDHIPKELNSLKEIIERECPDKFTSNGDAFKDLKGMLILIGNQNSQLAIYKHHYPISLLRKDSSFSLVNFAKPGGENRFKKLDQDILKIDPTFQFIRLDDKYYISDIKLLERYFGFHEAIKKIAAQGIENIKKSNLVLNCDVFEARINDITFSRKLVKSASQSPVLKISSSDILAFTNTHPALKGKFRYSSDNSQLDLKTKKSQDLFLKLLNDDFLQSELTKKYYESVAKDDIEVEAK